MNIGADIQSLVELRRKTDLLDNGAVFTRYERDYCRARPDPWATLGGLLCAKEACIKALSAWGDVPRHTFPDLEIRHATNGRPRLRPGPRLEAWAAKAGVRLDVTISHSGEYAMAVVLAQRDQALPEE